MKAHLLYSRRTHKTGKALAQALKVGYSRRTVPKSATHIIRWGNSALQRFDFDRNVLNMAEQVAFCVNREHVFRRLYEEINCPRWNRDIGHTLGPGTIERYGVPSDSVPAWLFRTRYGARGQDIYPIYTDRLNIPRIDGGMLVKYIPSKAEVRVHIFGGKSIAMQVKMHRDTGSTELPAGALFGIRNHDNGWILSRLSRGKAQILGIDRRVPRDLAKRAVELLGLDFAAVDLILGQDGKWYFLEANTGPGLEGSTFADYTSNLRAWLDSAALPEGIDDEVDSDAQTTGPIPGSGLRYHYYTREVECGEGPTEVTCYAESERDADALAADAEGWGYDYLNDSGAGHYYGHTRRDHTECIFCEAMDSAIIEARRDPVEVWDQRWTGLGAVEPHIVLSRNPANGETVRVSMDYDYLTQQAIRQRNERARQVNSFELPRYVFSNFSATVIADGNDSSNS